MKKNTLGVISGKTFLGNDDFVIWDCHTVGNGVFDGKMHFHDFYELSFVYDGEGEYLINGQRFNVARGFLLLVTPSDYHMLSVKEGSSLRYFNIIFRENLLSREVTDELYRLALPLCLTAEDEDFDSFLSTFRRIAVDYTAEAVDPIPPLTAILIKNSIETVCIRAIRKLPKALDADSSLTLPFDNEKLRAALLYIRENYRTNIKLSKIAEAVGLSSGYFSTLFKDNMGIGFSEYLLNYRLIICAGYVSSSDMSLKEIAFMNGFRSFPYFSQAFTAYFGLSPREYRAAALKQPPKEGK